MVLKWIETLDKLKRSKKSSNFLNLYQPEFSDPLNPENTKVPAGADYSAPGTWGYQFEHESVYRLGIGKGSEMVLDKEWYSNVEKWYGLR